MEILDKLSQTDQKPSFSLHRTILMRSGFREKRVMRVWQQMQSGLRQSAQTPVLAQGVLAPTRIAFGGQAMVWMRKMASSTVLQSLSMLARTITCAGPCAMQATRLLAPSIFTSSPAFVKAFVLVRK